MKKVIFVAVLFGVSTGLVLAQVAGTLVKQYVHINLKGDTRLVCTAKAPANVKGELLELRIPRGKTLDGRLLLRGEMK